MEILSDFRIGSVNTDKWFQKCLFKQYSCYKKFFEDISGIKRDFFEFKILLLKLIFWSKGIFYPVCYNIRNPMY